MVTLDHPSIIRGWVWGVLVICLIFSVSARAQMRNPAGFYIFPAEGTKVPVGAGSPCTAHVHAVVNESWWDPDPPPGETKGRRGQARTTPLSQDDVDTVTMVLTILFQDSPDMNTKTNGSCDRLQTRDLQFYVVRNDKHARSPAFYVKQTNLIVIDLGWFDRYRSRLETRGNPPGADVAHSVVLSLLLRTLIAHEMHHAWKGDKDPDNPGEKGGAVENENQVAREVGHSTYSREAYKRVDPQGQVYVPYKIFNVDLQVPIGSNVQKSSDEKSDYCCALDDEDEARLESIPEINPDASHRHDDADIWLMDPSPERKWTLTFTGGFAGISNPQSGDPSALPPLMPLTTVNGRESGIVPSWLFGEGTELFNAVMRADNRADLIIPLDPVLLGPSFEQRGGLDIGGGVSYQLSDHLSVFGDVRVWIPRHEINDAARAQVEATAASDQRAWSGLIAAGANPLATSTASFSKGTDGLVSVGGGIEYHFLRQGIGGWRPSARLGAGVTWHTGEGPSATVVSNHRFVVPGAGRAFGVQFGGFVEPGAGAPFSETDRVTITADTYRAFGVQFGGAVRRRLTDRVDVVFETMVLAYQNKVEIELTATPERVLGTPAGVVTFGALQLSNVPGVQSSLSGAAEGVTTFVGTGLRFSPRVAGGFAFRF